MDKELEDLIVNRIIDKEVQIHHYTSLDGLKSIIENNTFRFTECCYMNDKEEYNDVLRILDILVNENKNAKTNKSVLLDFTRDNVDENFGNQSVFEFRRDGKFDFTGSRYFVMSTTTKKDSLPMWHYYSKGKTIDGSVISLNVNKLKKAFSGIKDTKLFCGKVVYDDEEKKKLLDDAANIIAKNIENDLNLIKGMPDDEYDVECQCIMQDAVGEYINFIERIRLFFKSKSFDYEKEYRLLLVVRDNMEELKNISDDSKSNFSVKFLTYEGIIRTHIDLKFDKSFTISNIMFSPTADLVTCSRGVIDLLRYYGYTYNKKEIGIEKSKCSIRF